MTEQEAIARVSVIEEQLSAIREMLGALTPASAIAELNKFEEYRKQEELALEHKRTEARVAARKFIDQARDDASSAKDEIMNEARVIIAKEKEKMLAAYDVVKQQERIRLAKIFQNIASQILDEMPKEALALEKASDG